MADGGVGAKALQGGAFFALHCRGDVRLYSGEADCTPKSKKGRALLAVLAAEQRPLTRIKIIDLLWSDRQEEQARASLRTLLADLKEQLGNQFEELLVVDRERVTLGPAVRTDLTDATLARPAGELFEGLDHLDPELDEWLRVERERWSQLPPERKSASGDERAKRPSLPRWVLVAVLLLSVVGAAILYLRPWSDAEQPVIAVLKFKDLTGQNALLADGLAEELRIQLAQNPGIQVIGQSSSESENVRALAVRDVASALGASHVVEGVILRPVDGQAQLSLRLIDAASGRTLWNTVTEARGASLVFGPRPAATTVASILSEIVSQRPPPETMRADANAYEQLFRARELLSRREAHSSVTARQLALSVNSRFPEFVPALITLAEATIASSDYPYFRGPIPLVLARREAESYASKAIRLAPSYGPAYGAMARVLIDREDAARFARKAVQLSPGSGSDHQNLGLYLFAEGDQTGALRERRIAARLEPLDVPTQLALIESLSITGKRTEAKEVLEKFVRQKSSKIAHQVRAQAALDFFHDWSTQAVEAAIALREDPDDTWTHRLNFWAGFELGGIDGARPFVGERDSITAMIIGDDVDALTRRISELGPDFWNLDFETSAAIHYLVTHGRTDVVVHAFDATRDHKDMRLSDLAHPELIAALQKAGRRSDAQRLLQELGRKYRKQRGLSEGRMAGFRATELALSGDRVGALAALERVQAEREMFLWNQYDHPYSYLPFQSLASEPRFVALARSFDEKLAREQKEALAEAKQRGLRLPYAVRPGNPYPSAPGVRSSS